MQALIQRVAQAAVTVEGRTAGRIGAGLLVLLCAERGDDAATADRLLAKLLKLRIFGDEAGKMNRSVHYVCGDFLLVSKGEVIRFQAAYIAEGDLRDLCQRLRGGRSKVKELAGASGMPSLAQP